MDTEPGDRHQQLTSGQDTWSARCVETRTSGAAGGPGKRTGSNPDTAPGPDPADSPERGVDHVASRTRLRRRSKLARPYMLRLIILILFTVPSVGPLL